MNIDNLHRYIKVPFTVEKPKEFFQEFDDNKVIEVPIKSIDSKISAWFESFNLKHASLLEGFYTAPSNKLPIHSDIVTKNTSRFTFSNITKFNFTWGSDLSTTRWWVPVDPDLVKKFQQDAKDPNMQLTPNVTDENDPPHVFLKENQCKMIYEKVINRPSILNVGQLHSTYNPTNNSRWTLSVMLLKKNNTCVNFNEALQIFKDVIDEKQS